MAAPIEKLLEMVEWREVDQPADAAFVGDPDALYATHEGVLEITPALVLRCYTLNDGSRVFDADDIAAFFASEGEVEHG